MNVVGGAIFSAMFVAEAPRLAAGRAASRDSGGMRLLPRRERWLCHRIARRVGAKADDELVPSHPSLYTHRFARAKSQVDVIPGDRRVPPGSGCRARDGARVRMPFDNFALRLQGGVIKRVRE